MNTLSKQTLRAFIIPIAFYRAINGSYNLTDIRKLAFGKKLTDQEWQTAITFYQERLGNEQKRNAEQQIKHQDIHKLLEPTISKLRTIVQNIPEIEDVLLVNSYSLGALKPSSDIDVLVICSPRLLWWARLKLTAALEKAGIRRKTGHIEEQICLSFFVTSDALNMEAITLSDDIYFYFWLANSIPLFGEHKTHWIIENAWLKKYLPNTFNQTTVLSSDPRLHISSLSYALNQLVRIPMKNRSTKKTQSLGPESSIVISDTMLKFHNNDRRIHYREKTLAELADLEKLF